MLDYGLTRSNSCEPSTLSENPFIHAARTAEENNENSSKKEPLFITNHSGLHTELGNRF